MSYTVESVVKIQARPPVKVDRMKKTPFILRVFYSFDKHHTPMDYRRRFYPRNEARIPAWLDTSLHEISVRIQKIDKRLSRPDIMLDFQLISINDRPPIFRSRTIGCIRVNRTGPDDSKTLLDSQFLIGDYMDVSVMLP